MEEKDDDDEDVAQRFLFNVRSSLLLSLLFFTSAI